jgi:hypothetical protein
MSRGGPRNHFDKERIKLENLLALCVSVLDNLGCAETRIEKRALTEYDLMNLIEVRCARRDIEQIKRDLTKFHPNRLKK